MTNDEKLLIMEDRLSKLSHSPKNIKCPGVLRKLRRQVRNAGGSIEKTEE